MKKSILVLAAIASVATFAQAPAAEAGGFRIGFGFGVPFGGRLGLADPSILQRATEANERVKARERAALLGRSSVIVGRPGIRREQAEQARLAKRPAGIAAAGKAETADTKKNVQVARPSGAPVVAAGLVAAPAVVVPAAVGGDRQPEAAQQQQTPRVQPVVKTSATPRATPAAPTALPVRQAGSDASPLDTGAAVAPTTVKPVPPAATAGPAKEASAGECLRYIAGAGVTIKVSCSE